MAQRLPISTNTSTTSLDSLFSRQESKGTLSNTPVETPGNHFVPNLAAVSELIKRKIQSKTVIVMVGLPASGKSTICKQLCSFMNKNNYSSLIYNAGNVRREMLAEFSDSEFFNPTNAEASQKRDLYAKMCMDNMLEDFKENRINVGILDATNSTIKRRQSIFQQINESRVHFSNVMVLDVSCSDPKFLGYNITSKAFNNDYKEKDIATSISDFKKRASHYSTVYEPVSEPELAQYGNVIHLSITNGGRSFSIGSNAVNDAAGKLVVSFVSNYYKLFGERYQEAVHSFYEAAQAV